MSLSNRRWRAAIAVLGAAVIAITVGASTVGAKSAGKSTSGTIWIAATPRSTGSLLYVGGQIKDKVLGAGAVTFTIKPVGNKKGQIIVKALKVTMWTRTGSLTGTGSALLTITDTKTGASKVTGGKFSLTKGTGGQKGHSFNATFTGSGNAIGALLTFHYKGTYK